MGELNQVRHHAVLAHGLAVQAIRARGKAGTKVGPAENINIAVPLIESAEHIQAAQNATREANAPFLTVILEGKYTDAYLKEAGKDAPKFTDEDLKVIAAPLDFVGINVYKPDLTQLQRATADGVPVNGYFEWSRINNLEWMNGFGDRFGLVHVDFKTQKRTPKMSASWFREAARRNAVV